jgi:hypothetical protein
MLHRRPTSGLLAGLIWLGSLAGYAHAEPTQPPPAAAAPSPRHGKRGTERGRHRRNDPARRPTAKAPDPEKSVLPKLVDKKPVPDDPLGGLDKH